MELQPIDRGIIQQLSPRPPREEVPPTAQPTTDQTRERKESAPPVVAKRPAPLLATVSRSLAQSGLAVATAETEPAAVAPDPEKVASQAENESRQAENATEALQAFTHSLLRAVNSGASAERGGLEAGIAAAAASPGGDIGPLPATAANGYDGLVSRLESLVQAIDGNPASSPGGEDVARLDTAFRDLLRVSPSSQGGSAPDLQTVLKNIIRNLQSTGDPTLASTGNVINTAA